MHCIIPAGGVTKNGKWKHCKAKGSFLFPVKALSIVFRGKLLQGIHKLFLSNSLTLTPEMALNYKKTKSILYNKAWVTFSFLDRKKNIKNTKTISGIKFLKLFAEHILPNRFVKIRHIGFLASRCKKQFLLKARNDLCVAEIPKRNLSQRDLTLLTTGKDPFKCPCCFTGEMAIVQIIPAIRGSPVRALLRSIPNDRTIALSR